MHDTTIGMNVLVVDDQRMSREVLTEALRPLGCRIRQVADADEALSELRLHDYPLMFIDLLMPGMDGYALARRIRRIEKENKREPSSIIAYSGTLYAENGLVVDMEKQRLRENGFDDGMAKPFTMESLKDVIDHACARCSVPPPPEDPLAPLPAPAEAAKAPPKALRLPATYAMPNPAGPFTRALIVDDDRFMLSTTQVQVEGCISHVHVAQDAEEALKLFCEEPFDLVLLDLEMPGMDGFALARKLRELETGYAHRTCLVALSGNLSNGSMLRKCAASGMDDCLTKPFDAKLFRLRLDLWQRGHYPARKLILN